MRGLPAAGLMLVAACVFARLPDIDQHLRALLHHRSILTHSILPALALLRLRDPRRGALAAGALAGTAAHLAADVTSPAVGYGQVWTPWPLTLSLGGFSPIWLGANALAGFVLALGLARRATGARGRAGLGLVGACAALAAVVAGAGFVEALAVLAAFGAAALLGGRVL